LADDGVDWKSLVDAMNSLRKVLDRKPRRLRIGYRLDPDGILNAYREGDINFEKAVKELERWSKSSLRLTTAPFVEPDNRNEILSASIDKLEIPPGIQGLHTRASTVLYNASHQGVKTIEDLCRLQRKEVLRLRNCGKGVTAQIEKALAIHGLRLGMTDRDFDDYLEGRFVP